ncbi:MAG TPA: heme-binding protein [Pirellulales bacterium]
MRRKSSLFASLLGCLGVASLSVGGYALAAEDAPTNRAQLVERLQAAVRDQNLPEDPAAQKEKLLVAASETLPQVQENVVAVEKLNNALAKAAEADDKIANDELKSALRDVVLLYTFKPLLEAKSPEGFPKPGLLGAIEVRKYPAYRLVRTEMKAGQDKAFWTLFQHIDSNKIEMTTPVEMTRRDADAKGESMAFLYENMKIGEPGRKGAVEVVDVPPMTVVSLGDRGDMEPAQVKLATQRLEKWLLDHKDEYKPAGEPRVMGYNSPMVPSSLRYFEVQIPIEPLTK